MSSERIQTIEETDIDVLSRHIPDHYFHQLLALADFPGRGKYGEGNGLLQLIVIFIKNTDGEKAAQYMEGRIGVRHTFKKIDEFETELI